MHLDAPKHTQTRPSHFSLQHFCKDLQKCCKFFQKLAAPQDYTRSWYQRNLLIISRFSYCKNGPKQDQQILQILQKWTKTRPADSLDIHQYLANLYLPWPTAYFYSLDNHEYLAKLYLPWPTAHFYSLDIQQYLTNLYLPLPSSHFYSLEPILTMTYRPLLLFGYSTIPSKSIISMTYRPLIPFG